MARSLLLAWATRDDYTIATPTLLADRVDQQRYFLGQAPATVARMRSHDEHWIGLVARDAQHDMPIGAAELCRGNLSFLVAPSWRGLGVARHLAWQVLGRDAFVRGVKTVTAHVLRSNANSRRVLDTMGFVEVAMHQVDVAPHQRHAVVFLERAAHAVVSRPAPGGCEYASIGFRIG